MASTLLNYFGMGSTAPKEGFKDPVRALPASWYTSQEMYELERRAIFSRKWLMITHKLRLQEAGDWLKYDVAGFEIVLCRDREGKINGFHNVCRHRAYPLVTETKGTAKIFACRYHGWSYGLSGKLAKAPGYSDLPGFDKTKNSLFPIHVHLDYNGFVWVNLDSKATPEIAWDDDFAGVDRQKRFDGFNFDDYQFDHTWQQEGAYNWKILADNYNECYHCSTTHPDLSSVADLNAYSVTTKDGYIEHNVATTAEQMEKGLRVAPTYFFPSTSMNVTPNFFFMQRFVPYAPQKSVMLYEVYRHKNSTEEDFQFINQMYKRVMSEDKVLCELSQRNLNAGIFINGEMHPKLEMGPLFFQRTCRDLVTSFHEREKKTKQEIWPARQNLPDKAAGSQEDVDFCSGLACTPALQEGLAW